MVSVNVDHESCVCLIHCDLNSIWVLDFSFKNKIYILFAKEWGWVCPKLLSFQIFDTNQKLVDTEMSDQGPVYFQYSEPSLLSQKVWTS